MREDALNSAFFAALLSWALTFLLAVLWASGDLEGGYWIAAAILVIPCYATTVAWLFRWWQLR